GLEGSGKSNVCLFIKKILKQQKIQKIILVHQPGSTLVGEEIRKLIKTTKNIKTMKKEVELLLMYAARVQLVEEIIKPALKKNIWVISDRHDLSSLAYQGGGLGVNKKLIYTLKKLFLGNLKPDLTIYLDVLPTI
ncbi:dTMP kinase, partial [Buchnera aphidicola]|nr:dTMP kinase [Buchnera aphidicola]